MSQKLNQVSAPLESAPATILRAITPTDGAALPNGPCRAFIVGAAGNVAVIAEDDTAAVTITGLAAGQIVPVRCKSIQSTNTTATGIVALY